MFSIDAFSLWTLCHDVLIRMLVWFPTVFILLHCFLSEDRQIGLPCNVTQLWVVGEEVGTWFIFLQMAFIQSVLCTRLFSTPITAPLPAPPRHSKNSNFHWINYFTVMRLWFEIKNIRPAYLGLYINVVIWWNSSFTHFQTRRKKPGAGFVLRRYDRVCLLVLTLKVTTCWLARVWYVCVIVFFCCFILIWKNGYLFYKWGVVQSSIHYSRV